MKNKRPYIMLLGAAMLLMGVACSSLEAPATASVAVSKAALESANSAGGTEFAPVEMSAARDKLGRAKNALAARDFKLAEELAAQAQADAQLAQAKANSAKAQRTANAMQDDIRILREELKRAR